jgi:hypothetical protein
MPRPKRQASYKTTQKETFVNMMKIRTEEIAATRNAAEDVAAQMLLSMTTTGHSCDKEPEIMVRSQEIFLEL